MQPGAVGAISGKRTDIMVLQLDSDGFEKINKEAVEKNVATLMPLLELFEFSLSSVAGRKDMMAVLADLDKASGYALTLDMEFKGQKGLYYDFEVQKLLAGIRYTIKLLRRTEEVKVKDSESVAMKELKRKYVAAMEKAKSKQAVPIIEIDDDDDEPPVVVVTPPPSVATPRPLSAHQQQLLQQMLSALSSDLAAPPPASVAQPVVASADTTTVDKTQIIDADSVSASATAPTALATPPPLAAPTAPATPRPPSATAPTAPANTTPLSAHRIYGKQQTQEKSPLQPPCSATLRQCEHAPTVDHSLQRKDAPEKPAAKTKAAPKKGAAAKTKAARKKGAAAKMKAARKTGAASKEKAAQKSKRVLERTALDADAQAAPKEEEKETKQGWSGQPLAVKKKNRVYDLFQVLTPQGKSLMQVTTKQIDLERARTLARMGCMLLTEGCSVENVKEIRDKLIQGKEVTVHGERTTLDNLHENLLRADEQR